MASPKLVKGTVQLAQSPKVGMRGLITEGNLKGLRVFFPDDGMRMDLNPYETFYLIEDSVVPRQGGKGASFAIVSPIGEMSWADPQRGREEAESMIHNQIQEMLATKARFQSQKRHHQAAHNNKRSQPKRVAHEGGEGGSISDRNFPFLRRRAYGLYEAAAVVVNMETSDQEGSAIAGFLDAMSNLGDEQVGCPHGVTLGSMVKFDGGYKTVLLAGPMDLAAQAARFMIENSDAPWRIAAAITKLVNGTTLTSMAVLTVISEEAWNKSFDPERIMKECKPAMASSPKEGDEDEEDEEAKAAELKAPQVIEEPKAPKIVEEVKVVEVVEEPKAPQVAEGNGLEAAIQAAADKAAADAKKKANAMASKLTPAEKAAMIAALTGEE